MDKKAYKAPVPPKVSNRYEQKNRPKRTLRTPARPCASKAFKGRGF